MLAGDSRLKCNGSEPDGVSRLIFVSTWLDCYQINMMSLVR